MKQTARCPNCGEMVVIGGEISPREAQVVDAIAHGYANKEIARLLHLSESTVRNHVTNIRRKLGVDSRMSVVIRALQLGLIQLPESPESRELTPASLLAEHVRVAQLRRAIVHRAASRRTAQSSG